MTNLPHVYIFSGNDMVGKEAVRRKTVGAVEASVGACIRELFDPTAGLLSDFLQKLITPTLFGDVRIGIINHVEKLTNDELAALDRILTDIPDDAYLIIDISDSGRKATGKTAPVRKLKAQQRADETPQRFVYRDFQNPPEYKIGQWLQENVPDLCGRSIARDAVDLLIDLAGSDTATLFSEIRKIDIHLDDGQAIDRTAVETVVGASRQMTPFELAAACAKRQPLRVMEVLDSLFETTVSVPMLVNVMYRHYGAMLRIRLYSRTRPQDVKMLLKKGGGGNFQAKNEAAFRVGCAAGLLHAGEERKVYPVVIQSGIVDQAHRYTDKELERILAWLLEFDVAIKTGRLPGTRREVELFCYKLLRVSHLVSAGGK